MRYVLMGLLFLLFVPQRVSAQTDDDCTALREAALLTAAESCAGQSDGSICLGHASVESLVICDDTPPLSMPGDTIPLQSLCALRLSALQDDGQWGIAYMNVPTAQGSELTMILLGDLDIQNAASASSQMRVWAEQDLTIHSGPGRPYEVLRNVTAGEVLLVNACNCTRNWLRTVLEDGRVGWVSARDVTVIGEEAGLPVVERDAPLYEAMQAFSLNSGEQSSSCAPAGVLIQTPDSVTPIPLQINGIEIKVDSTVFAQSQSGTGLQIMVLEGTAQITAGEFTATAPAGTSVVIPLSTDHQLLPGARVVAFAADAVAQVPLALLPRAIDLQPALNNQTPQLVGAHPCDVVSGKGEATCPLHFVNRDGDALTRMDVSFLQAPQGEWTGSVVEPPQVIAGDAYGGQIAWMPSCTLGAANFIGPVRWAITLTDEQGHTSPPFEASFNCIDG